MSTKSRFKMGIGATFHFNDSFDQDAGKYGHPSVMAFDQYGKLVSIDPQKGFFILDLPKKVDEGYQGDN